MPTKLLLKFFFCGLYDTDELFPLALTIVVGVEYGAKNYRNAKDYVHLGLQLSLIIASIYMLGEYFSAKKLR